MHNPPIKSLLYTVWKNYFKNELTTDRPRATNWLEMARGQPCSNVHHHRFLIPNCMLHYCAERVPSKHPHTLCGFPCGARGLLGTSYYRPACAVLPLKCDLPICLLLCTMHMHVHTHLCVHRVLHMIACVWFAWDRKWLAAIITRFILFLFII